MSTSNVAKKSESGCSLATKVFGFRDYYDDLYGRRRYTKPAECDFDALDLKTPYPLSKICSHQAWPWS
jgi:hypothetical protein